MMMGFQGYDATAMSDCNKHTEFALNILFGDQVGKLPQDFRKAVLEFNTAIDNARESGIVGTPFSTAVKARLSEGIRNKLGDLRVTSFDHRYFFHWGYTNVRISMNGGPTTNALIEKIKVRVEEHLVRAVKNKYGYILSDDEQGMIKKSMIEVIDQKAQEHSQRMKSISEKFNLLGSKKKDTALAIMLYEIHILADYATSRNIKEIKPLQRIEYHVKNELIEHGLLNLDGNTRYLEKRLVQCLNDQYFRFLNMLWLRQPKSFRDSLPLPGKNINEDLRLEQKRALKILCLLQQHLPDIMKQQQ